MALPGPRAPPATAQRPVDSTTLVELDSDVGPGAAGAQAADAWGAGDQAAFDALFAGAPLLCVGC